jgi:iron complex transport system substrate-binding protein
MRRWGGLVALILCAVGSAATAAPAPVRAAPIGVAAPTGAPARIVSLNPCLDAILLQVADPGQIAALSHYSRDPSQSAVWAEARRYPFTYGSGEEVAALKPDLVLTSGMGAMALAAVLPRLHIQAASFGVPSSVEESLAQVRRVARLAGHPERGEALAARINAAFAAAAPPPGTPRIGALIYEYHGLASGPGTLMDEMMRRAGFDNFAARYGLKRTVDAPLEQVLAEPPPVLLAGSLGPGQPTWADRVLSHPALKALAGKMRRESFPETLMFCGGPQMIPAMAALARARTDALRGVSR